MCLLLSAATLWAAGPTEEYIRIYTQMQQAESLESSGRKAEALATYLTARKGLTRLKAAEPTWNRLVVDFRLKYLNSKIQELASEAALSSDAAVEPGQAKGAATAEANSTQVAQEVAELQTELQRVKSENTSLQSKLKEALAVRPAAVDPRELAKVEERNRTLSKEVTLLKVSLQQAETKSKTTANSKEIARLRDTLRASEESLAQQKKRAAELAAEQSALEDKLAMLMSSQQTSESMRVENAVLKQQVAKLKASQSTGQSQQVEARLTQALAQVAMLSREVDIVRLEKTALENRLQQTTPAAGNSTKAQASTDKQVVALKKQLAALESRLEEANRQLLSRSVVSLGEPTGAAAEVTRLKARLAAYEAEKTPYSVEELALFRMSLPRTGAAASVDAKPPASAGKLIAEAEQHFQHGQFQQAERVFKQVLQESNTNAFTLANLAATQMERNEDAEAGENLRKALAIAPKDPFTLTMFGYWSFRQKHLDEALDYLSLAAQYKPDNATIQNYLGVVLSEKGMRGPAETALRRALQLQPGFSQAHYNLALIYATQKPPVRELARWHYQKALESGHPRSTEIEQMLDRPNTN